MGEETFEEDLGEWSSFLSWRMGTPVYKSKETPKLSKHEEEETERSVCQLGGQGQLGQG